VTPRDVECEGFNVTYTRIASGSSSNSSSSFNKAVAVVGTTTQHHSLLETDVDRKVDESIESFLRSLSQIGPELLSVSTTGTTILYILLAANRTTLLSITGCITHHCLLFSFTF
jgi:hypothetical protein